MNNISVYDELDHAIERMLFPSDAGQGGMEASVETSVGELVQLAEDLRDLPRANFKTRLKLELQWEVAGRTVSAGDVDRQVAPAPATGAEAQQILPSLFGKTWAGYPVR